MAIAGPVLTAVRQLWDWIVENRAALWIATVAAYPQLHLIRHGTRPDMLILPGLALVVFLVIPWAGAIIGDNLTTLRSTGPDDERSDETSPRGSWVALALALVATGCALAVAVEWGHGGRPKQMYAAWQADPSFLVQTTALAVGFVLVAANVGRSHQPASWGLSPGNWRWWGPLALAVVAVLAVTIPLVAWIDPSFVEFYPRHPDAKKHGDVMALALYQISIGTYMFAWEFFFRGFMLFGFARILGPVAAILLQAYPFFLLHHKKPETELVASWFGGIVAGWFAWRSKSCWPTAILHTVMYSTMEVTAFIVRFGWPGSS